MCRRALLTTALIVAGCGDGDPQKPVFSNRDATESECPNGGTALLVDGELGALACNGADGERGAKGDPGPAGAQGPQGTVGPASSSNIISDTVLCQANDGVTFLSAYIWLLDAAADPTDNIGICTINENGTQYSATTPMIGLSCTLEGISAGGLITLNLAANPPTVGGALAGTMNCL